MKRLIPTLFLIVASLCFMALATQAEDKPAGADLFKQKCSMCHGADGKGFAALKTPDFTDPKWQRSLKDKDIIETIKNGKKGTPMPPFADKLKEDEIQELVNYIRSLNSEKKK
ncbi:MAG: c-type cytochrome [Acidobacteriia bacterium]|nr:c-type cytochrome [Terriglobia bacterium]